LLDPIHSHILFHSCACQGHLHGPDGLLQHPLQPGNLEEEEDDFEDWVDRLYGFLHIVHNLFPSATLPVGPPHQPLIVTLANAQILSGEDSNTYSKIPQMQKAKDEDDKLVAICIWDEDLIHPEGISNSAYKQFLQYATLFFPDSSCLWKKDTHGVHKLVIYPEDCLQILSEVHDNLGHWEFYAIQAAILQ